MFYCFFVKVVLHLKIHHILQYKQIKDKQGKKDFNMKTKTVTFSEYITARKNNEGKSYSDILDMAVCNSKEEVLKRSRRKNTIKLLSIGCFALFTSTFILSPSSKAFADVLGMQKLAVEHNFIVYKLQIVGEFYTKCLNVLGVDRFAPLFVKIAKEFLTPEELYYFVSAAKGMTLDELVKLLPTLPTLL